MDTLNRRDFVAAAATIPSVAGPVSAPTFDSITRHAAVLSLPLDGCTVDVEEIADDMLLKRGWQPLIVIRVRWASDGDEAGTFRGVVSAVFEPGDLKRPATDKAALRTFGIATRNVMRRLLALGIGPDAPSTSWPADLKHEFHELRQLL